MLVAEWELSNCCELVVGVSSLGAGGGGLARRLTVSMGRFMESGWERREERDVKGTLVLCACGR